MYGKTVTVEFKNDKYKSKIKSFSRPQFIFRGSDIEKLAVGMLE
jgi:hypothetical protein